MFPRRISDDLLTTIRLGHYNPSMPSIDPHIFRAYDIRGKAATQVTPDACRQIGHAFGTVLRRRYKKEHPEVIVGRDARTHGPQLEAALVEGLMAAGCNVLMIGATPSPLNYFTICNRKADGGVHVTASHNPKEDNGLKLQTRDAEAYSGDNLQELRKQIEKQDFENGTGSKKDIDAVTPYRTFLKKLFGDVGAGKKVVVDAGNGIAGPVNCEVFRDVGAEVVELFTEPDGTFPNHAADPSKHETLQDLQEEVTEWKADIGFGFDGDGDRLGLVDEHGAIRNADETILLLAQDHLRRHPGAPVVFTVSNSGTLETEIAKWGGKPVMCKVGHSYVEHAMMEQKALLGGEQSGHFFCGEEYFGFDDALVAALRVLKILSHASPKTLSTLMADFPKVYQAPELRPYCDDAAKTKVIAAISAHFATTHKVITLDGVRIDFGEGAWAGIRQSNTSPCISICMEARTPEKLEDVKKAVLGHVRSYPEVKL
jgi:phosphomannomutase/phosphoglucomutase